MSQIEKVKTYTGRDLETIFYRPMLTGESAEELGIRVMYNMPVPTNLHFWRRSGDILQKFTSAGWNGSAPADKYQKTINMSRVKAEIGYSAADYFSMVYELITNRQDVNMEDLSGTELEQAETELFRQAIAESIRATMWLGDTTRATELNTFDGIIPSVMKSTDVQVIDYSITLMKSDVAVVFQNVWNTASDELRALKGEGQLALFVTSDVYNAYMQQLDSADFEAAYIAGQQGRSELMYRGIPVIDLGLTPYISKLSDIESSFVILTDRRNLALAVNTSSMPDSEIRMWYNPDQMENRQRATFLAGADYLLPELIVMSIGE